MELFYYPLSKTYELKNLCKESLEKIFNIGIVKKLRKFKYWAKKNFLIKKLVLQSYPCSCGVFYNII